jgi:hypothetical protein
MNRALILALAMGLLTGAAVAQDSSTQTSTSQSGAAAVNNSAAQAQSQTQATTQTGTSNAAAAGGKIAAGSTLQVALSKSIDAKKAKVGDEVVAKTTMDAVSGGQIIIPRGSKVIGHVTEAKARAKGDSESMVGIAFEKAVVKGGQEIPLSATIQAIAPAPHTADLPASEPMSAPQPSSPGGGGYGRASGGGGMVGNTTQTATSTVGGVANTAGNVGGLGGTTSAQTGAVLNSSSRGVVGLSGIELQSNTAAQANGSVVASKDKNVKLDSGTQMVLQVQSK